VDLSANKVVMSPLFSWHEKDFTDVYASKAPPVFSERSPVERAVLALLQPKLLGTEVEFIQKNAFKMEFGEFDWRLNDLTGRGGR
jgi:hypothetical protein